MFVANGPKWPLALRGLIWVNDGAAFSGHHFQMLFSRRELLLGAAKTAVFCLSLPHSPALAAERFANPLKIPALIEGNPGEGGKLFELGVQAGTSKFLPSVSTPT